MKLCEVNEKDRTIELSEGNYFGKVENNMKLYSDRKAPAAFGPYAQAVNVNGIHLYIGQIPVTRMVYLLKGQLKNKRIKYLQT